MHVECLTRNVSKNGTLGKGKVIFAMIIDTLGCLAKKTKLGQSESVFASYPQACQRGDQVSNEIFKQGESSPNYHGKRSVGTFEKGGFDTRA